MFSIIILYILISKQGASASETDAMQSCLLELQISELLRLQHSLQSMEFGVRSENTSMAVEASTKDNDTKVSSHKAEENSEVCISQNCMKPMAMALTGTARGYHVNAGYHEHHPWQPEEKPSKLQTLFHISVTALSFLSFGGYLLCLIVQAIKSKGTTYFHPIATASTTAPNGAVKRIKIYRRGRRDTNQNPPLLMPDGDWVMNYGYAYWI